MRFLLYPSKHPAVSKLVTSQKTTILPKKEIIQSNIQQKNGGMTTTYYGQKCSPNCGCAVRFEADIDLDNRSNHILSMTYDAKTIVSTVSHRPSNDGSMTLTPVYTSSTNRGKPLMTDCKCQTVHSLASAVVETLPQMSLSQAQNQLEFLGVRSSPAFRYTVLRKQNLLQDERNSNINNNKNNQAQNVQEAIVNVKYGHCFDLIEDALTACLNGYLPKPRRNVTLAELNKKLKETPTKQYPNRLMEEMDENDSIDHEESNSSDLDPLRFVRAAKKRTAGLFFNSTSSGSGGSAILSSSMPPFHLMGSNDETYYDTLSQLRLEQQQKEETDESNMNDSVDNWLSYVDEIERTQGSY